MYGIDLRLIKEANKILKADGWIDDERWGAPKFLWRNGFAPLRGPTPRELLAKWNNGNADYYAILNELCYRRGFFKSPRQKKMWSLYCDGYTTAEIVEHFRKFERGDLPKRKGVEQFIARTLARYNRLGGHFCIETYANKEDTAHRCFKRKSNG
jgi:hypothetical protein